MGDCKWEYRIIKHYYPEAVQEEREVLEVHEVFYNEDGSPHLYRPDSTLIGSTLEEIKVSHMWMVEAFSKPVLDERDFQIGGEDE